MTPKICALTAFALLTACASANAPIVPPATDLAALRADAQLDNAVLTAQRVYDTLPAAMQAQAYPILAKAVAGRKAADAAVRMVDGKLVVDLLTFNAQSSDVQTLIAQFHAIAGK